MYEDLDAPQSTDWLMLSDIGTGSGSGGPSSSQKKSKRVDAIEKNPCYPPRVYTAFVRPVAMRYYAHKDMDMLECSFLNNGLDGYIALCKELCNEFMNACDTSEQFNNYLDYWDHMKCLDTIVTINTTNVVKGTFEVLYPKKGGEEYDESKKQLLAKLHKIQAACRRFSGNKTKTMPWWCKHLKGPWKCIWVGGWYGYHRMLRSLKYQEIGWKVGMQRYDGYASREWRTFLVT
jgi:hypothetical protein